MHNLDLTDETFDVNQGNHYVLLMQSSLNGFSYAVCDSVRNKCILLKHFEKKSFDWYDYKNFLTSVIASDPNLKLPFKSATHIIINKEFSLVPEEYFPQKTEDLQQFFPALKDSSLNLVNHASKAARSEIVCIYPSGLLNMLKENFPGATFSHFTFPFINELVNESSRTLRHVFHFLVTDSYITAGVAHSTRLDFVNAFPASSFEDYLYYVVSVLEKFKISPLLAEISIQNDSSRTDFQSSMQNYIGKVRNLKASQHLVYSYILTEDILEHFANMLNLYHCE
jgi:hypothetical protein